VLYTGNIFSGSIVGKDVFAGLAVLHVDKSALSQEISLRYHC